jgi:hypothetical protein
VDGMDLTAIKLLDQIGASVDLLNAQGYSLYLALKARTWDQARRIVVSRSPFRVHRPDRTDTFDRCLSIVCTLYPAHDSNISIQVAIDLMWTPAGWHLEGEINRFGPDGDECATLWSKESDHQSSEILINALQALTDTVISQTNQPWFSALFKAENTD